MSSARSWRFSPEEGTQAEARGEAPHRRSMVSVTGSLLSLLGEPEAESSVPSSTVSWRIILAVCGRVRSSFLPVFSVSPDLSYPTLSLLVSHFLIIILAVAVFGVEQYGIKLWLALFSRLGSYVLYWIMTSDSQSSCSGRDTLLYSSVGDFWVVCPARSGSLFAVGLLGSIPRGRSHSSSEFVLGLLIRVHLRRSTVFPASNSKREVG